jgi:hypothetical protein
MKWKIKKRSSLSLSLARHFFLSEFFVLVAFAFPSFRSVYIVYATSYFPFAIPTPSCTFHKLMLHRSSI